jgi:hypothetical protein
MEHTHREPPNGSRDREEDARCGPGFIGEGKQQAKGLPGLINLPVGRVLLRLGRGICCFDAYVEAHIETQVHVRR